MGKAAFILILVFMFSLFYQCEKELEPDHIDIPDTGFLQALIEAGVDIDSNGVITADEASKVERLEIERKNISEMSGIELVENLRQKGSQVKYGFITSEGTPEMRERAKASGAIFFISKPFIIFSPYFY